MNDGKYMTHSVKRKSGKTTLLLIALSLLLCLAIGGTVAYLMDRTTDALVNTFTPSKVGSDVEEGFDGTTKSNVAITNTGDVDAYVRVALVAYWVDAEGKVCPATEHASFDINSQISYNKNYWTYNANDGYYYYNAKVGPGETTKNLFDSYKFPASGDGCNLELVVMGSAIQAASENATGGTWGLVPSTN